MAEYVPTHVDFQTPSPLRKIQSQLQALMLTQKPPNLEPRREEAQKHQQETHGLFGNSIDLLKKFNVPEDAAYQLSKTITDGKWMFNDEFLHKKDKTHISFRAPRPISEERKTSGSEPQDFQEIPTAEIRFSLRDMITAALKESNLKESYVHRIMAGYTNLTRYKDFGLSCIVPAEMPTNPSSDPVKDFGKQKDNILRNLDKATDVGIIMGGWTSSVNFAQEESKPWDSNGPKNEANLAQQFFWRKQEEGKRNKSFIVTSAGPGMENNEFADTVTPENPFGPTDHMLGMSAAFTLFGKSLSIENASFLGHSMSGAAMLDVLQHYTLPNHWKTSILSISPAIAGTNAWANAAERSFQEKFNATSLLKTIFQKGPTLEEKFKNASYLQTLSQKGLSVTITGFMDIIDTAAKQIISPEHYPILARKYIANIAEVYEDVKGRIADLATQHLFLDGDRNNMPQLVSKHVENFKKYGERSTLTALGSILDLPLDPDRLEHQMRKINCALVVDADDQMVDARNTLKQLPYEMPMFVFSDSDKGSHYSSKRNERHKRMMYLQQAAEQMDVAQFHYLTQTLCKKVYDARKKNHFIPMQNPKEISEILNNSTHESILKELYHGDENKYQNGRAFITQFLVTLGNEIHFNNEGDPLFITQPAPRGV